MSVALAAAALTDCDSAGGSGYGGLRTAITAGEPASPVHPPCTVCLSPDLNRFLRVSSTVFVCGQQAEAFHGHVRAACKISVFLPPMWMLPVGAASPRASTSPAPALWALSPSRSVSKSPFVSCPLNPPSPLFPPLSPNLALYLSVSSICCYLPCSITFGIEWKTLSNGRLQRSRFVSLRCNFCAAPAPFTF